MKCGACGANMNADAKFCGECGAKVEAKVGAGGTAVVDHIELAPLALSLAECKVEITGVEAEGPNDEGDLRVTVKYTVTNETNDDWEYLEVCTQILSASGQIVEGTRDASEQSISAGETADLEASLWGMKGKLFGSNPEQAHVVITAIASGAGQQKLGEVSIPDTPFETVSLKSVQIGDTLKLVSGSLWKTDPDDEKGCLVEIKALVQNLTNLHLPKVTIEAKVTDKQGRDLTDAGCYEEIRSGNLVAINGRGYAKAKMFAGAKADLAIFAYWPLAAGSAQNQGMSINAVEQSEQFSGHEDSYDSDEGDSSGESRTFTCRELVYSLFRYSTDEFCALDMADELERWKWEFDQDRRSSPTCIGSTFDADDEYQQAEPEDGDMPDGDAIYVVAYYFYDTSSYNINGEVDATWTIHYQPIVSYLEDEAGSKFLKPMAYVSSGDREEYFEGQDSSDGTDYQLAVFRGSTQLFECALDTSADEFQSKWDEFSGGGVSASTPKSSDSSETPSAWPFQRLGREGEPAAEVVNAPIQSAAQTLGSKVGREIADNVLRSILSKKRQE